MVQRTLTAAGFAMLVVTGCRRNESVEIVSLQPELHSFGVLASAREQLWGQKTNEATVFQIDNFMIWQAASVAEKRSIAELSSADLQVLRATKRLWQEHPPEPREIPESESKWQTIQKFLKQIPPSEYERPSGQVPITAVGISDGPRPRMLKLLCYDSISEKPLTNYVVSVKSPSIYVSLYPSRTNSHEVDFRFILNGVDGVRTPSQMLTSLPGFPALTNVYFTIRATNYAEKMITIPVYDFETSKAQGRSVSLTPVR